MKPVSVSENVNDNTIECETKANHLEYRISSQDSESLVKSSINSFWRSCNLFAAEYDHTYGFVNCKLLKQYCCVRNTETKMPTIRKTMKTINIRALKKQKNKKNKKNCCSFYGSPL